MNRNRNNEKNSVYRRLQIIMVTVDNWTLNIFSSQQISSTEINSPVFLTLFIAGLAYVVTHQC